MVIRMTIMKNRKCTVDSYTTRSLVTRVSVTTIYFVSTGYSETRTVRPSARLDLNTRIPMRLLTPEFVSSCPANKSTACYASVSDFRSSVTTVYELNWTGASCNWVDLFSSVQISSVHVLYENRSRISGSGKFRCIESQPSQTDPRDALHHTYSSVHKGGRSVW